MTETLALINTYLLSPYTVLGLLVSVLMLIIVVVLLYLRLSKVFKGTTASSLEPLLHECLEKIKELESHDEALAVHAEKLDRRVSSAIRNVSTIRFKAFESGSSNQSFAIALVDEKGTGVVLSSLHNRDRMSTYAKPLVHYKSSYDLTEEELHVIEESKTSHQK